MNNTSRTITFIMLSSLVLMTAILLQGYFFPPKPADLGLENQANQEQVELAKNDDSASSDDTEETGDDIAKGEAKKQDTDNTESSAAPDGNTGAKVSNAVDSTKDNQDAKSVNAENTNPQDGDSKPSGEPDDGEADRSTQPGELISLGSLTEDGTDRFLLTLNSKGGNLRRIELNTRYENGKYKYRDLEHEGGYLGCLDAVDHEFGCMVRFVGKSTPAEKSGLQVGDIITSIDDKPVISAEGMEQMLFAEEFKPGTNVTLTIIRSEKAPDSSAPISATKKIQVLLTDKPIELVRPEPPVLDATFTYPESFRAALMLPVEGENWKAIDAKMSDSVWDYKKFEKDGVRTVEFSYELAKADLDALKLPGPIKMIKRFWLKPVPEDQIYDYDYSKTFDIGFEIEIENGSDQDVELGYQLDGPTGLPTEGWWYQVKTHGRSTAIGSIGGARDIISSSKAEPFKFLGGAEIVSNVLKKENAKLQLLFDPFESDIDYRTVNFLGVDALYFNVMLIPVTEEGQDYICYTAYPWTTGGEIPTKDARRQRLVDVTTKMFTRASVPAKGSLKHTFDIFSGPKERKLLQQYDLENTRVFGWFGWFSKMLVWLLGVFYAMTFEISYAIPIIMLTVLVRSLMIPVSRKAALNAQMMQYLQPKMKEIAERNKDNMEKRAAEQRELFKKYNYNPLSGCLMGFLQLPIFIGLYRGLSADVTLRDQPLIPGLDWCTNLAAPDQLLRWDSWMPGFLASESGWLGPYLNLLPLITCVLFLMQQKLFTPPPTDDQQKFMQKMMTFMMIFMGLLFFKVPAGLCLYFITSSIWGILERKMLPKPKLDTSNLDVEGSSTIIERPVKPVVLSDQTALENRRRKKKERERRRKDRES